MPRPKKTAEKVAAKPSSSYLDKIESEVQSNQSRLSLVLGALIVLVIGILVFNYFNKDKSEVGPSQETTTESSQEDVKPENLPGKYTVKESDTLFIIAEKYYHDGTKYSEIVKANNLTNENVIEAGQVLEIPKLEQTATPSPTITESPTPTEEVSPTSTVTTQPTYAPQSDNKTFIETADFGPKITGNTYTVQEGDWLSTIAGRAYGDIYAYQKIAQANNISNPDLILPGQVLTIPR